MMNSVLTLTNTLNDAKKLIDLDLNVKRWWRLPAKS